MGLCGPGESPPVLRRQLSSVRRARARAPLHPPPLSFFSYTSVLQKTAIELELTRPPSVRTIFFTINPVRASICLRRRKESYGCEQTDTGSSFFSPFRQGTTY